MKITVSELRRIIREETQALIRENLQVRSHSTPLLAFAQAWSGLGISVQEQVLDLVDGSLQDERGVNLSAIESAHEKLSKPLKDLAHTSSDAADLAKVLDEAYEDFIMVGGLN